MEPRRHRVADRSAGGKETSTHSPTRATTPRDRPAVSWSARTATFSRRRPLHGERRSAEAGPDRRRDRRGSLPRQAGGHGADSGSGRPLRRLAHPSPAGGPGGQRPRARRPVGHRRGRPVRCGAVLRAGDDRRTPRERLLPGAPHQHAAPVLGHPSSRGLWRPARGHPGRGHRPDGAGLGRSERAPHEPRPDALPCPEGQGEQRVPLDRDRGTRAERHPSAHAPVCAADRDLHRGRLRAEPGLARRDPAPATS